MIDQLRKEGDYTVREVCEALDLSRSGYDAARSAPVSRRKEENRQICEEIKAIHSDRHAHVHRHFLPWDPPHGNA